MNPQQQTTLIKVAQQLLARVGHLKRYQPEVKALQEAIAQATASVSAPTDDRPVYARLMPVPEPSETFLEKVARLEQEALNAAKTPSLPSINK